MKMTMKLDAKKATLKRSWL